MSNKLVRSEVYTIRYNITEDSHLHQTNWFHYVERMGETRFDKILYQYMLHQKVGEEDVDHKYDGNNSELDR